MPLTTAWDETKPAGTRSKVLGDDDIREFKQQMRERLAMDHYFLQNEAGDEKIGYHKKATFLSQASDPTVLSAAQILFAKTVGSYSELHSLHETNTVQQLTHLGNLWVEALDVDDASQGDLIWHNGTKFTRLPIGTALQQIRVNAGETDIEYFTPSTTPRSGSLVNTSRSKDEVSRTISVSTGIPIDSSKPQNTEGGEYTQLATAHTAENALNWLHVKVFVHFDSTGLDDTAFVMSLFRDSVADALTSTVIHRGVITGDNPPTGPIVIEYYENPADTSAHTYKVRLSAAGATTSVVTNKCAGGTLGGNFFSSMVIKEIKA